MFYRQLYYSLQLQVDREIRDVLQALENSSFYENTIIVFTSDHGELLGAHGGLFQKWYQAYEEAIHVPLIIHNPKLFKKPRSTNMLTSHVDVVPTLLGLAGIKAEQVQAVLKKDHTEVHPFVGRNLAPLVFEQNLPCGADEPIYFMTDDNVTKGLNQVSVTGIPYPAVRQPNSIETVVALLPTGRGGKDEIWKYSRYFANPQFDSIPGRNEQFMYRGRVEVTFNPGCYCGDQHSKPVPDEFEMYNLTTDPLETVNLAHKSNRTPVTVKIQLILSEILKQQRAKKRLYPTGN